MTQILSSFATILTLLILPCIGYSQVQNIYWDYPKDGNDSPTSSSTTRDVDFVTSFIGYSGGTGGRVYKTTNNFTWILIKTFSSEVQKISFKNQNEGAVLLADKRIYITTNGGSSWILKGDISTLGNMHDIFYSSGSLIAVGNRYIHRLISSGQSFIQEANIGSSTLFEVFALESNSLYVWAGGSSGRFYRSINGGNSWNQVTSPGILSTIRAISFVDTQNGWIGADDGLWKTTNGGSNWTRSITGMQVHDVIFKDSNNGYISANNKLYVTADGGTTIQEITQVRLKDNSPNSFNLSGVIRNIDLISGNTDDIWGAGFSHGTIVNVRYNFIISCICIQVYDPVCGSDGVTYSNSCHAACAGVSWTSGACFSDCPQTRNMTHNSLPSGSWQATQSIFSTGGVNGNSNVEFVAGNSIILSPGFYVAPGGIFTARIAPCTNSNLNSIESSRKADILITNDFSIEKEENYNYSKNSSLDPNFEVYPNPSTGKVTVGISSENLAKNPMLFLVDVSGKEILTKKIGTTTTVFNWESIPNGLYFIRVQTEGELLTKQFVKLF